MGIWGTALFSDDTACDLRDEYTDHLGDGLSGVEATDRLLAAWLESLDDSDEGPVVWLSLAATQWKLGRLEPRVLARALEVIDGGTDLDRWQHSPGDAGKRRKVLESLRRQLESPMPLPRKVFRRFRSSCDWQVGEVVAYRIVSEKQVLFRVTGHHTDRGGTDPIVGILSWNGKTVPDLSEISELTFLTSADGATQFHLAAASLREFPVKRLTRLGLLSQPSQSPFIMIPEFPSVHGCRSTCLLLWRHVEQYLSENFDIFKLDG
jgi:hypothetical protein